MTLRDALRLLKEERVLVFAIIVFTIVGAVAAGQLLPPDRTATAMVETFGRSRTLLVPGIGETASIPELDFDVVVDTHIRLATTPAIAKRVIARLGLSETPQSVLKRMTVSEIGRSTILSFEAVAPDADSAVKLADTWVSEYVNWRAELSAAEYAAAASALTPRITAAKDHLEGLEARVKAGGHTKELDTALAAAADDYQQLLSGASQIALLSSISSAQVGVISEAVAEERSETLAILIDALKGLVAGAFLAVIIVFVRRRPTPVVQPD